jgi:predicted dehydrogenase/threonine dehydrogenase-like Zn-dependent dehydrogenase
MKQVLQSLRSGETTVVEVPVPSMRPNTALVRTAVSLVSAGTERMVVEFAEKSLLGKARSRPDLVRQVLDKARREGILGTVEAAFNRLDQPMALGYSSAGTITALGAGIQGFQVGQRVACAGGNAAVHAEYGVIPRNLLTPLPEDVDFESAAFTTLGAIALHGFRLAEAQLGERVAVIGLGLLGLLAVQIARVAGCSVLGIDLDARRVALAEQLGVEAVPRPQAQEAAQSFTRGLGCDAVLICADTPSADPVELAGAIARDRGRVVAVGAVGLQLPRKIYYEKELSFINSRSYGPGRYDPAYEEAGKDYPPGYVRWTEGRNLQAFVELLQNRNVDVKPLISHRFPIDQAPDAYRLISGKSQEPFLGVLLHYPPEAGSPPQPTAVTTLSKSGAGAEVHTLPAEKTEAVRLGVLGAGNFASAVLLPAIRKVSEIDRVVIASGSGLTAQHAGGKFGFTRATSDTSQVIGDPGVNTLAILTRHNLHARLVLEGLAAGKHIFCEKPLSLTMEDIDAIEQALTKPTLPPLLMVGFNRRFAPLAKEMAAFWSGRHEPLVMQYRVNAGYIPPNHWVHDPEQGGGRILGEACHFIDLMTFLAGGAPVSVQGSLLDDGGRYREDNASLQFEFPDGSLGTLNYLANGDKAFSKERLEVFGGGRVSVLDDFRTLELVQEGQRRVQHYRLRQDKGHLGEWQAFSAAILQGGPPPIPYTQLFGVSRATLAALQALRTRERVALAP